MGDKDGKGYITLNEWIRFAITHIAGKIVNIPKDCLSGSAQDVTKQEFLTFIKKAVNRNSEEYKEVYGEVGPAEFDEMIECAAEAPRRFGLAPKTEELFKTKGERFVARIKHFSQMNTQSTGKISFDEWLNFTMDHIVGKVNSL